MLRAARISRRFAPEEAEGMLARAYAAEAHQQASGRPLRGAVGRPGSLRGHRAGAASNPGPDRSGTERARARARLRHALGPAASERRGGLALPRRGRQARSGERRRVPFPARGLRQEGGRLGSRPHAGRGGRDEGRETATRASSSRRQARLRGGSSATSSAHASRSSASVRSPPEHPQLRAFEAQIGESLRFGARGGCKPRPSPPRRRARGARSPRARRPRRGSRPALRRARAVSRAGQPVAPHPRPLLPRPPFGRCRSGRRGQARRAALARREAGERRSVTTSTSRRSCSSPRMVPDAAEKCSSTPRQPTSTSPSSRTRPRP